MTGLESVLHWEDHSVRVYHSGVHVRALKLENLQSITLRWNLEVCEGYQKSRHIQKCLLFKIRSNGNVKGSFEYYQASRLHFYIDPSVFINERWRRTDKKCRRHDSELRKWINTSRMKDKKKMGNWGNDFSDIMSGCQDPLEEYGVQIMQLFSERLIIGELIMLRLRSGTFKSRDRFFYWLVSITSFSTSNFWTSIGVLCRNWSILL